MYGLFLYEYDYHEWEKLEAVSSSIDKLEVYYKFAKERGVWDNAPLVGIMEHGDHVLYRREETPHYLIKRVTVL